jgi:hypothetical protein
MVRTSAAWSRLTGLGRERWSALVASGHRLTHNVERRLSKLDLPFATVNRQRQLRTRAAIRRSRSTAGNQSCSDIRRIGSNSRGWATIACWDRRISTLGGPCRFGKRTCRWPSCRGAADSAGCCTARQKRDSGVSSPSGVDPSQMRQRELRWCSCAGLARAGVRPRTPAVWMRDRPRAPRGPWPRWAGAEVGHGL